MNGTTVGTGTASTAIALSVGSNAITVRVTAPGRDDEGLHRDHHAPAGAADAVLKREPVRAYGEQRHELRRLVLGADADAGLLGGNDELHGLGAQREDTREGDPDGGARLGDGHCERDDSHKRHRQRRHSAFCGLKRHHGAGDGPERDDEGLHGNHNAAGAAGSPHGLALGVSEPGDGGVSGHGDGEPVKRALKQRDHSGDGLNVRLEHGGVW